MENLLGEVATNQIKEMIKDGWEFYLHFGDHSEYSTIDQPSWEADFTRKLDNGKWDNHQCGYADSPDSAINDAYLIVKNGFRLKSKS